MNRVLGILTFVASMLLLFACGKDDEKDQPTLHIEDSITLRIDRDYNCYVADNNDQYYSGTINPNEIQLFRLHVQAGVRYQLASTQPISNASLIKMTLLEQSLDTLETSFRNGRCSSLFFTAENDRDLLVAVQSSVSETVDYKLYYEIRNPRTMIFANEQLDYIGNWQESGPGQLTYTNIDICQFRWLRLHTNGESHLRISFTLKAPKRQNLPSMGFICDGSPQLHQLFSEYQDILPRQGTFFNIENNQSYTVARIYEDFSSYDHGTFEAPDMDIKNGVKITVSYENSENQRNCSVYINDALVSDFYPFPLWYVYIILEDWDFDTYTIEDFTVERS